MLNSLRPTRYTSRNNIKKNNEHEIITYIHFYSSEDRLEKLNKLSAKTRVGEFLRRILRWNKRSSKQDGAEIQKDILDLPDDSPLGPENDLGIISTRDSEDHTDHGHLYEWAGGGSESTSTHSGLYNLEQE